MKKILAIGMIVMAIFALPWPQSAVWRCRYAEGPDGQ